LGQGRRGGSVKVGESETRKEPRIEKYLLNSIYLFFVQHDHLNESL